MNSALYFNLFIFFVFITIVIILTVIAIVLVIKRWRQLNNQGLSRPDQVPLPRAELRDSEKITGRETWPLAKRIIKIGRGSRNDIPLPGEVITGLHAVIEYRDGFFYLIDHCSRKKTYLGSRELEPNVPVALKNGDVIRFGAFEFVFVICGREPSGDPDDDFKNRS